MAQPAEPRLAGPFRHAVQFYDGEPFLVEALARFVDDGLSAGDGLVMLATDAHRRAVSDRLRERGVDPAAPPGATRLVWVDAAAALARIVVDGSPDAARFDEVVGDAIAAAAGREPRRVRVFGELVALLCADGDTAGAIRLEELWRDHRAHRAFSLLCAYPTQAFRRHRDSDPFAAVCCAHDTVAPSESFPSAAAAGDRDRVVAQLQQKARALEDESEERATAEAERDGLSRELERRVADLAEADRRKDEFLAALAHELRNPLAPIRIALKLARARAGDGAARYLEIIDRQAESLCRIVDDLLDVSRITHGKIELRPGPVDLATLVSRAVDATRHLLEQRAHDLAVTLPAEEVVVRGDPVRLEQVLVNLLTNATKYTPPGGHVWLEVEREGDVAVLRVRDDGVGIPPELLGRVFDLFQQAERTLDRPQGGLGIGLTLARRLAAMHGGTLEARSEGRGRGATFTLKLPVAAPEARRAGAPERPPPPRGGLRVLVVDDNADAGDVLAELLRDEGHDVRVARGGEEALRLEGAFCPALVLLDLGMPGLDGFEVARRLGAAGSQAQLVAVSGYGQPQDRARTAAARFAGHLVKPVQLEALRDLVDDVRAAAAPQLLS